MNLALEYLFRKKLLKHLIEAPCSIAIEHGDDKKIITITKNRKWSFYSVTHWNITKCKYNNILPPSDHFLIKKKDIFNDDRVVVPEYNILQYKPNTISSGTNCFNRPMKLVSYYSVYDNFFNSEDHRDKKENWLWQEFKKIYLQNLYCQTRMLVGMTRWKTQEIEKEIIAEDYDEQWHNWQLWCDKMLFNSTPAGELIFYNEYSSNLN